MDVAVAILILILVTVLIAYLTAKSEKVKKERERNELMSLISAASFKACYEALEKYHSVELINYDDN